MKGEGRYEFLMAKAATTSKKAGAKVTKKPVAAKKKAAAKKPAAPRKKSAASKKEGGTLMRYKCRVCGYIYSPLRGEPHNGIPAGTPFEDLPDTYLCSVCGFLG